MRAMRVAGLVGSRTVLDDVVVVRAVRSTRMVVVAAMVAAVVTRAVGTAVIIAVMAIVVMAVRQVGLMRAVPAGVRM